MINVHASLLPRWRGAAPIIYAIMNGDTITGVSVMKIVPKYFDIGDVSWFGFGTENSEPTFLTS